LQQVCPIIAALMVALLIVTRAWRDRRGARHVRPSRSRWRS
jgi:hypothetical protein